MSFEVRLALVIRLEVSPPEDTLNYATRGISHLGGDGERQWSSKVYYHRVTERHDSD